MPTRLKPGVQAATRRDPHERRQVEGRLALVQRAGHNRDAAYTAIRDHQRKGEVMTGLLYLSPDSKDVHDQNETVAAPLYNLPRSCVRATTRCRSYSSSSADGRASRLNAASRRRTLQRGDDPSLRRARAAFAKQGEGGLE